MNRLPLFFLVFIFSFQTGNTQIRFDLGVSLNADYGYRFLQSNDAAGSVNRVNERRGDSTKRNTGIGGHLNATFKKNLKVTIGLRYADLGFNTTKDNAEFWHTQRFTDIDVYRAYYEIRTVLFSVLVEKVTKLGKSTKISYGGGINNGFIYDRMIWQTGETFIEGNESSRISGHGRGFGNQNDIRFRRYDAYYLPSIVATASIDQQVFKRWSLFSRISYSLGLRDLADPFFTEYLYLTSIETGIRFNFSIK